MTDAEIQPGGLIISRFLITPNPWYDHGPKGGHIERRAAIMRLKICFGAAIVALGLSGGALAASAYPPNAPPANTTMSSGQPGSSSGVATPAGQRSVTPERDVRRVVGDLPATGSDAGSLGLIAAGVIVTGGGLVLVARRRAQLAT